jgi:hypothetical protein
LKVDRRLDRPEKDKAPRQQDQLGQPAREGLLGKMAEGEDINRMTLVVNSGEAKGFGSGAL